MDDLDVAASTEKLGEAVFEVIDGVTVLGEDNDLAALTVFLVHLTAGQ